MTIINELDSTCGISDEELTIRFKESIRIDNEVRKIKGLPIAGYDDETKRHILNIRMGGGSMSGNSMVRLLEKPKSRDIL